MTRVGPDHDRWAESTGAYALGALSDDESAGFAAHAEGCAACREELAGLGAAVRAVAASAPRVEPPPELKRRVMAEVEREAALLAAAGPSADRPAEPARERRSWRWLRPAAALAAVAAAVVVVAVLAVGGDGTTTFPATMDRAQVASDAGGELRVHDDDATLVVRGMRPPEAGRVYQVWVKRPGRDPEPTSALFTPRANGSATTSVPAALHDGDAVLVTSEPEGGSRKPTRPPIVSAPLS